MNIEISKNQLGTYGKLKLSKSAYSNETLLKASYHYTDKLYIFIAEDSYNYEVNMSLINQSDNVELSIVCGEFINELADQEMRQTILKETGAIREAIVSAAFSEAAKGLSSTLPTRTVPKANHSYVDDKVDIIQLKG